MAVKSNFASGDVLTASDVNTYLTNGGLVYITQTTLSGTSKDVTSIFSSTYTNYLITLDSLQTSGTGDIYLRMLSGSTAATAAEYFWAFTGYTDGATASNSASSVAQTFGYTGFVQSAANNIAIGSARLDVFGPNLAQRTFLKCATVGYSSGTIVRDGAVRHNLTTAYDGIQFLTNSAVTMGGNVTVYGYRKP